MASLVCAISCGLQEWGGDMNVRAWEAVKGRVMGLELICPGLVLLLFSNLSSHLLCPSLECLLGLHR